MPDELNQGGGIERIVRSNKDQADRIVQAIGRFAERMMPGTKVGDQAAEKSDQRGSSGKPSEPRAEAAAEKERQERKKQLAYGLASAGLGAAGSAFGAFLTPRQTAQERAANIAIETARAGVGAAAGATAEHLSGSVAAGQQAAQFAGNSAAALANAATERNVDISRRVANGAGDLAELAGLGFEFDDDFLQRRAERLRGIAERQRDFEDKWLGVASDASPTLMQGLPSLEAGMSGFAERMSQLFGQLNSQADGELSRVTRSPTG